MERVAEKTKMREDLEKVFEGNKEKVDDIMTLAMFPYISSYSYSGLARWQRYTKTPSAREMSPGDITRLTQSITEKDRQALLRLRSERIGKWSSVLLTPQAGRLTEQSGRHTLGAQQGEHCLGADE